MFSILHHYGFLLAYQALWFPFTLAPLENINTLFPLALLLVVLLREHSPQSFKRLLSDNQYCDLITAACFLYFLALCHFSRNSNRSAVDIFIVVIIKVSWHATLKLRVHISDILSKSAASRNPAAAKMERASICETYDTSDRRVFTKVCWVLL